MNTPFNITKDQSEKAYEKLQLLDMPTLSYSTTGNKASAYYFNKHRFKAGYSNTKTPEEQWKDPETRSKILEKVKHMAKKDNTDLQTALDTYFRLYGSMVSQFRPSVAAYIYQKYKPHRVLDLTAGWGDRLVSALAKNIDYIGIDTNKELFPAYNKMIHDLHSQSDTKLINKKAETVDYNALYNSNPYDLIFTSPPYYDLEKYKGSPEYPTYKLWFDNFLMDTIEKAIKPMKQGTICLNIPNEIYNDVKKKWRRADHIHKMPIISRWQKKDGHYKTENVYCWKI